MKLQVATAHQGSAKTSARRQFATAFV
jgi:hypothetical protein